jgi:3-isopropylmalate/(R)-2-methylmalate dehydratase small subunit
MRNESHYPRFAGIAAVLDDPNIDTDIIFPARFLLLLDREGLGVHAFEDRRLTRDGKEVPGFVLNQDPFRDAKILVAGPNFGCGSSREHAVWALHDRGIRCVIAPSFGEIFYNNSFRNGLLPIVLDGEALARVRAHAAAGQPVTVDLQDQAIELGTETIPFDVKADKREAFLAGLDDIGKILGRDLAAIETYEARRAKTRPWAEL